MTEPSQLCATDKEIFDILFSRRRYLSDSVLFGLAQDRRTFCSHLMEREALADYLSGLQHDYNDLQTIIERSEQPGRGEKATFVTFEGEIAPAQIKTALEEYARTAKIGKLSVPIQVATGLTATLSYTEIDYSKTRLAQKQPRDATLVFSVSDGMTTVRLPSTEMARTFVDGVKKQLEVLRTEPVATTEIDLSALTGPELRTRFFTRLISAIPNHRLQTVVNLKVASFDPEVSDEEDDAGAEREVSADVLAVVRRASLTGENLIATPQFKSLQDAGFFVSAIRWRSSQTEAPRDLIQFEASLENPVGGTGLRYLVRYAPANSMDSAQFRKLTDIRERNLLATMQRAAQATLHALIEARDEVTGDAE